MKRRYHILSVMAAGMILAGGSWAASGQALAAPKSSQESGIRAKAPQENGSGGSSENKREGTEKENASEELTGITQEEAKQIALQHAELSEEELTGIRIKRDRDDGRMLFEIELYRDAEEYGYEIDADTGEIVESDYEVDEDYSYVPQDSGVLTREEAAAIVLEKVEGASEKDIRLKYEFDDGYQLYEGDLVYDGKEYEFELNAENGKILEWSEERY